MRYLFGEDDADTAARAVERALRDLSAERTQRAVSGREQVRKAARRNSFDPAPIAARALLDIGVPPSVLDFLPKAEVGALGTTVLEVPAHEEGLARLGETLFDAGDVILGDSTLLTTPSQSHSQVIVALLTTDPAFAGDVRFPQSSELVERAFVAWNKAWTDWRASVEGFLKNLFPRHQHAQRRREVARELERQCRLVKSTLDDLQIG